MTPILPDPSRLIDVHRVTALLGGCAARFSIDAIARCDSTSSLLLQRADAGAPSGSVIVADLQTAGRGSRGRNWMASPDESLTFSLLWRFECGLERLSGLSLAVGVAVVNALAASGVAGVTLKWPNDILFRDGKLGGILVELHGEPEHAQAVIGIGLNLRLPQNLGERSALMMPPAALAEAGPVPERHALLAALLDSLARVFERFAVGGFSLLRDEWMAVHAWQDRPVRLLRNDRVEKEGICRGADSDGALLVETSAGIERCLSGDLSVRPR